MNAPARYQAPRANLRPREGARLLPAFVERYPKIEVEARVENQFVNIVADGPAVVRDLTRLYGPMPGSNIGRSSDSPSNPGQCFRCNSMNSVAI